MNAFRGDENRRAWAQDWRQQANADRTFNYQAQQDTQTQQRQARLDADARRKDSVSMAMEYTPESMAAYNKTVSQQNPNGDPSLLQKRTAPSKAVDQPGYWEGVARQSGLDTGEFYDRQPVLDKSGKQIKDENENPLFRQNPSQQLIGFLNSIDRLREQNPNMSDADLARVAAANVNIRTTQQQKETTDAEAQAEQAKSHHWWTRNDSDYEEKQANAERLRNEPSRTMRNPTAAMRPALMKIKNPTDASAYAAAQGDLNSSDPVKRQKAQQVLDMLNQQYGF